MKTTGAMVGPLLLAALGGAIAGQFARLPNAATASPLLIAPFLLCLALALGWWFAHRRAQRAELARRAMRTELARRAEVETELRRDRRWLQAVEEALPLGVVFCDKGAVPEFANQAWLELTESTPEELGSESLFLAVHPDDRDRVRGDWERSLAGGIDPEISFRLAGTRPDGAPRWAQVQMVRYGDDEGHRPNGHLMIWEEVTSRIEHLEELQRAIQEAKEASQAKSDFLAHMSHEIRTPLTGILGHAEMLADPAMPEPERGRVRERVRRGGDHLKQIINDILDLSKIELGKLELERLPTCPWRAAQEAVATLRAQAEEKGIALAARATTPLPRRIVTDPTRLRQVLFNLVSNAIKFSEKGEVTIRAAIEPGAPLVNGPFDLSKSHAPRPAARLRFDVEDQGMGMSPDQLKLVFTPFQQGDGTVRRRYGGTGLGLSISRKLANALDGSLTVRSKLGEGSTFTLLLPIGESERRDLREPSVGEDSEFLESRASRASDVPPALKGRVLLAEDSEDVRRIVRYYLARTGVQVDFAENGRVALDKATESPGLYELILMDMQMPEMDGYEATRQLRIRGHQGPILALTAQAMRDDREKCIAAGCTDYLTKPIDPRALYSALGQFLPHRRTIG